MYKLLPFLIFILLFSCNSATDKTIEQPIVKVDSLTTNHLQKLVLEEKIDLITDEKTRVLNVCKPILLIDYLVSHKITFL